MLALAAHDGDCCKGCGTHKSVLADPENNVLVPDQKVCPVCAGLDQRERVVRAADRAFEKGLGKDPDPKAPRPDDGRSLFMRPATPEELAERAAKNNRQMTRQARSKRKAR